MSSEKPAAPAAKQFVNKKEGKSKAPKAGGPVLKDIAEPQFWQERIALFDELFAAQNAEYAAKKQPIKITMPDGKVMEGESWVTSPGDLAKKISNSLADKVIVAKVNNETLWDLGRPLEEDCSLELLDWEYPEAREVFWHSSAHVLGFGLERVFGCKLSYGPPLADGGFFYEGDTDRPVTDADYPLIESAMSELVKAKQPYQRLQVQKETALKLFAYNDFKAKTLAKKVPEGGFCTVYRCGNLIDPCRGPHLPDTGRVKAICVTKNSSAYFQGNADNAVLQRVYAMAFPKADQLKEWKKIVEEASKRDHRVIARQQDLFFFHDVSPGSAFFHPHGARIYNTLIAFQRKQYRKRGFEEVISPNMYNSKLWQISGHWELYKDAMFRTTCEHEEFGLKPMNCPGHCIMFANTRHSYRELPIRLADFGTLHRNELSGALTGLTRVRRFQQDDGHIFCRLDQIKSEMDKALEFMQFTYGVFGFNFFLKLSTKPANALGSQEVWDNAESMLSEALNDFCGLAAVPDPSVEGETFVFDGSIASIKKVKRMQDKVKKDPASANGWGGVKHTPWEVEPGDGAFYGPKIDIVVEDALKKRHQCATIQLDFNMPERFGLKFTLAGAKKGEEPAAAAAAAAPKEKSPEANEAEKATEAKKEHVDPTPKGQDSKLVTKDGHVDTKHLDAKDHHTQPVAPVPSEKGQKGGLQIHIDRHLEPNEERPVMIHRAIFGSLERCIAILCEHYGGKWPFWLSPRQAIVIPISLTFSDYANEVKDTLFADGFFVDVDLSTSTLDKKVREAQLAQFNFILVVGADEKENNSVSVRTRDNKRHGVKTVSEVSNWFDVLAKSYDKDF